MSRHYLLYWKLAAVEYRYYGDALDHLANDHLKKVSLGDVVWVVTLRSGDLLLAGRVVVGELTDAAEGDAMFDEFEPFSARWHVSAAEQTAEPMQLVNLSELGVTMSLRFESQSDRLRLDRRGRLNAMSLFSLRQLTDETAALLNYVWYDGQESVDGFEQVEIGEDTLLYMEGTPITRTRKLRQRSSRLTDAAKQRYLAVHGELRCEVCGINFEEVYGELGEGYIEAHHAEPLSKMDGAQFVDVEGIVLLCANCHRVLHRRSPPYSIEKLREIVEQRKQKGQNKS